MTIVCAMFLIPVLSSERKAGEVQEHGVGRRWDGSRHPIDDTGRLEA
jgi:hypothetical protein